MDLNSEDESLLGFIGLGSMGGAMVRTLLRAGYRILAYDIDAERLSTAADAGANPAESGAAVVAQTPTVLTSLRSSEIFVEVAQNDLLPNARAGQVFIDLGTTTAPETRRLAAQFTSKGATLLDVPVSGGPHGSETGTLRMFAGGDEAVYRECLPILHVLGDPERVVYCGESGSGQVVKGVNQLAMGLGVAAYVESVAFGVRAGVDPAAIRQAVGGSDGWRAHFDSIARLAVEGQAHTALVKFPELGYFLSEAANDGFPLPMTEALFEFLDSAERIRHDNMGRPIPSFWHELMTRHIRPEKDDASDVDKR